MRIMHWAVAALAIPALIGCGDRAAEDGAEVETTAAAAPSDTTLAASIEGAGQLGMLSDVIDNAGLAAVLEGVGPYTVFAPADGAFSSAGAEGEAGWTDESMRAHGAALLRAHVVPGALTRSDIEAAIAQAGDGQARMRTMGETMLTFARQDGAITITAEDGAQARLVGEETVARNGVLHPVDGLLRRLEAPTG